MNKNASLKDWGILFLIFCMVVTAFVSLSSDWFDFYNTDLGDDYQPIYDHIETSIGGEKNTSFDMHKGVSEAEISDPDVFDTVSLITSAVVTVLKLPFLTLYGVITTISLVAAKLPIPSWIITGTLAILMISLSITILAWIFNRRVS